MVRLRHSKSPKGSFEADADVKKYVAQRLDPLVDVLSFASIGDFTKNVHISKKEDEFTPVNVGVQVLLDVIRDKIRELEEEKGRIEADKKQLGTLFDSLPVGVYIAEVPSGKPILVNKKATELVGRSFDPEAGVDDYTKTYDLLTEEGKKYPTKGHPLYITIKKGIEAKKSDLVVRRPNKSLITLKVQSVPVHDKVGNLSSAIAVFDDITKEREVENLKSQFVSLVSHQLRTPLSNMRWNIEMLLKGDYGILPEEIAGVLKDVYESDKKLIILVNDILNVSHIEEGKELEYAVGVSPKKIIHKVLTDMKPLAREKMVKLHFKTQHNIPRVFIDPKHLFQIVQNLVSNAINYNVAKGKVTVHLRKGTNKILILVEDTGIGIPEKDRERIFDKFFRTENAIKSQIQGSGLGLYIVKTYVKKWGGNIIFTSKEGKGSTFFVELPIKNHIDKKTKT